MSIFKQINELSNIDLFEQQLQENIRELEEDVTDTNLPIGERTRDNRIAELSTRLDAAKRGLGLANKLKNAAEKKQHLSRIMGNLNRLRGALQRIIDSIEAA